MCYAFMLQYENLDFFLLWETRITENDVFHIIKKQNKSTIFM